MIRIGLIDLKDKDRWTELGLSSARGWQQGCLLQWVPGSKTKVLWNERTAKGFVCRIDDIKTQATRTVPQAIHTLAPDGKSGLAVDFHCLHDVRPGDGYAGLADPHKDELTPNESGVWHVDLANRRPKLLVSIANAAKSGEVPGDARGGSTGSTTCFTTRTGRASSSCTAGGPSASRTPSARAC